jgi:hypothetical protein
MKCVLTFVVASAVLFASNATRTFTGVITDSMCGADHKTMKISPDPKCVKDCVRMHEGSRYVLFDGKNTYKLSDQQTPEQFAAQRVKITGQLFEKTGIIKVEKIEAAGK